MFQPTEFSPLSSTAANASAIASKPKETSSEKRARKTRHGGVLRIPFLKQLVQTFDDEQRPLLQVWPLAQQTVFEQQVSP